MKTIIATSVSSVVVSYYQLCFVLLYANAAHIVVEEPLLLFFFSPSSDEVSYFTLHYY